MLLILKEDFKYHQNREHPFYKKLTILIQEVMHYRSKSEAPIKNNKDKETK
jgi:hypothetical protein